MTDVTNEVVVAVIGGPTAFIEVAGLRILTDPTFSPPGVHESAPGRPLTKTEGPAKSLEEIGHVDLVLLSHDQHADNLDPAGRQTLASVSTVLSTPSAASRLGGVVRGLRTWDQISLLGSGGQGVDITAVPARHGPPGCEPLTGEVTGFVLSGDAVPTVYVSGDNASLDAVQAVAARCGPVDLALLFAGAARTSLFDGAALTLTSREAAAVATVLAARAIVPLHVRGWAHFSEGPEVLQEAFESAGVADRLHIVEPREPLVL